MIEATRGPQGQGRAKATCDFCTTTIEVPAAHGDKLKGAKTKDGFASVVKSEAQVILKVRKDGWDHFKGKLYCPACASARRQNHKEKPMAENVTELRQPTREQRRHIMELLGAAYDADAGRYVAGNTDLTVAGEIGGGVMPGWVSEIREQFFGPDGGNDDMETLIAELTDWQASMEAQAKAMHELLAKATADLRAFNEGRGKAAEFLARVEKIKAAVGPKARAI